MTTRKNIKDLLDRLIRDDVNPEELDFLYQSLNHQLHEEDVKAWLYRNWDEAPLKTGRIRPEEILENIRKQIDDPVVLPRSRVSVKRSDLYMRVARMAAVFILGFTIAWFISSGRFQKLVQKDEIAWNELHIPLGSKSKIVLSDGTQIWLNAGSTLKYPGKFRSRSREIFLEGEAFFDVTHDKDRPFRVSTPELHIKVLGTRFNVKSYPEDNTVETTLISGSIEIEAKQAGRNKKNQLRLEPNQKATFIKTTNKLTLDAVSEPAKMKTQPVGLINIDDQVNTDIVTSWTQNRLVFSRERFEDIAVKLERWYNVQIIIEDEEVKNYLYTGTFNNETLEQALNALRIASDIHYTIDKDTILIYMDD